jgi:hypothetical protein
MWGKLFSKVSPTPLFLWGTFEKVPHTPQNFHTFFIAKWGKRIFLSDTAKACS